MLDAHAPGDAFVACVKSPKSCALPCDCISTNNIEVVLLSPPNDIPRPRFLSVVFPFGGTIYVDVANDQNPSNTTPVSFISFFKSGVNEDAAAPVTVRPADGATAASDEDDDD